MLTYKMFSPQGEYLGIISTHRKDLFLALGFLLHEVKDEQPTGPTFTYNTSTN